MNIQIFLTIERDGVEFEISVTGEAHPAEHDVGIMSDYVDDVCADGGIELTEAEIEQAEEEIREKYASFCDWQED